MFELLYSVSAVSRGNTGQEKCNQGIILNLKAPIYILTCVIGDLEKVSELISGLAPGPEEESPYEALFEATSCHSLDSLTSGKSSDRDSGRPDSEAGKVSSSFFFFFLLKPVLTHKHTHSYRQNGKVVAGFYRR